MKKVLIIKVGSTLPSLAAKRGDFEDWILSGMGIARGQTNVVDVSSGQRLPAYEAVRGIVITGSHAMVTEHQDWSEYTAKWLPQAVDLRIPTLGICYGHQLLAHCLGGTVDDNPRGREFGTVEVRLHGAAQTDLLFQGMANPIRVHVSHTQSVLNLPPGARLLASSELERHQAFAVGDRAWGVQFHPEFDAEIVSAYISHHRPSLVQEGIDADESLRRVMDTRYGSEILARFHKIIRDHENHTELST